MAEATTNQFSAVETVSTGPVSSAVERSQRREKVLPALSQAAQLAQNFHELVQEAGVLTGTALEGDLFASVEKRGDRLSLNLGSTTANVEPIHQTLPSSLEAHQSGFQFAIESLEPVLFDTGTESRFHDGVLASKGVRTGLICPIHYRDEVFGAIGVLRTKPHKFTDDDLVYLQSIAMFLGPAIAHLRAEQSLLEHSQFVSLAIDALDAMVVLLAADGSVMQINRTCQAIGGFTTAEIRGRHLCSAFCQPEESEIAEGVFSELRTATSPVKRDLFFVTKQGAIRRIHWTFAKMQKVDTAGPSILATGVDITERKPNIPTVDEPRPTPRKLPDSPPVPPVPVPQLQHRTDAADGRKHDRRPYQCIQLVAPCVNGKLPEMSDFREVRCYDISPGGFAFLLTTRPVFDELVAGFGTSSSRLYLRAKIKHVTTIEFEGRKVLKIGCAYLGRVRMPGS